MKKEQQKTWEKIVKKTKQNKLPKGQLAKQRDTLGFQYGMRERVREKDKDIFG